MNKNSLRFDLPSFEPNSRHHLKGPGNKNETNLNERRRNAVRNFAADDDVVADEGLDHFSLSVVREIGQVSDPELCRKRRDVSVAGSGDAPVVAGLTEVVVGVGVDPEREVTLSLAARKFVAGRASVKIASLFETSIDFCQIHSIDNSTEVI